MPLRSPVVLLVALLTAGADYAAAQGRPRAEVSPYVTGDTVTAGSTARLSLEVRLPEGLHVQADRPRDPALIPTLLTVDAPDGVTVKRVLYPESTDFEQIGQAQPLAVFEHLFITEAEVAIAASVPAGELRVPGRLRYQACDDRVCFAPVTERFEWTVTVLAGEGDKSGDAVTATPPEPSAQQAPRTAAPSPPGSPDLRTSGPSDPRTSGPADLSALDQFTTLGTTGGYLPAGDFLQFITDSEQGVQQAGLLEGRGPLAIILIVLLGGLALNLTPCVLPMIPVNLAIIGAGAQARSRGRGLLLGLAYGGAMALIYGALGLVVILTAGTFGTINASPWFNVAMAALFVALALAMFDVFAIDFSRLAGGPGAASGRGSFALAFTMGAVAALLAGACVAPVVIQVVLFASSLYATGTTIALALPFVLGIGMAIPWPVAGAGIAALPKPGPWMVRVKQVMGVVILVTAAYYGWIAYGLFANRWVDPAAVASSVEATLQREGWTADLAGGLALAEREGRPVLIDFWATWCKNCLTMDETTFRDDAIRGALADYVKIKFQAEDPDAEPARSMMARFKAVGLPTYVILRPETPAAAVSSLNPGGRP